jgi:peptide/nickel transport system ATP-binding protein
VSQDPVLETRDLTKRFWVQGGLFGRRQKSVRALHKVNLRIYQQETLGVVGESGCGKTTLGRAILRLTEPTSGQILFEGQDLVPLTNREMRRRRIDMQMVFQQPFQSFDPRYTVLQSIGEPLRTHSALRGQDLVARARALLRQVGMPGEILFRYPHEFSGGQLQRIALARTLALRPKFVILDEPTSALDVSVQAPILNLLQRLQNELKLTYLFISHDLSVVQHISDRIVVMYLGQVVEQCSTDRVFCGQALHPYTRALLASAPILDPERKRERIDLRGSVPDPANPPPGCSFHPRCPVVRKVCARVEPQLIKVGAAHEVACHLVTGSSSPGEAQ